MAKEIKTANLYSIDDGKKTEFEGEPTFENSIKHFEELLDRELRMTEQKDKENPGAGMVHLLSHGVTE
jgi:hypothetical protein